MDLFFITTIFLMLLSYFAFSSSIFRRSKSRSRNRKPPAAGGAWPITGHLHIMTRGKSDDKLAHITLTAMAETYGPIYSIRLGTRPALIVSSWELAKEIYTTCDMAASSRPFLKSAELISYDSAMFGFSKYGTYWRELRKLISVELLSSRRLHIQRHVLLSETAQSVRELYGLWNQTKNPSGSAPVEMIEWFGNLNLNAVLRLVVGKRYAVSDADVAEAKHCRKVMKAFFELIGVPTIGDVVPFLRWLDIGGFEKKMKQTFREMDAILSKWLSEHRAAAAAAGGKQDDFMDIMIGAVKSAKLENEYDEDTIIKATCSNLISGSDTNTVMLVWLLTHLLNNPKVLNKVQQELDEKVGRERRVEPSDIDNLIYLEAVVKECLRLYPAGPLSGIREFNEDCNVGGYEIEKGTIFFVNIWKLQRDPQIWEDPDKFLPERFLGTAGGHKDFQWVPFGGGRRICPGANLAMEMMKLVIASLVQSFDVSTPDGEAVDMSASLGVTLSKATPLNVLLAPRLAASLY
ncbi:cytochrome P450 CYP82D47-like [Andrographis paniculata]|uniref:cytochrome P450 CYP82D47-like n=1 Tax=Andrographis paniculata TaxID=175694 RepID=UPI0021E8CB82|nr:cytochrome P450 CYP82D47-like [Andrographis paniculata]